jgi:hypothetical protein
MMTYTNVILLIPLFVSVVKLNIRIISFLLVKSTQMLETLFTRLFKIDLINIDTNLLLWGNTNLSLQTNTSIFAAVHKFIEDSCRFK